MNSLSWFLYFADVLNALGIWLTIIMVGIGITTIILLIGGCIVAEASNDKESTAMWVRVRALGRKMLFWFVFCGTIAVIIPAKNTMYAIAASQMGEVVAKSEVATDAMKALHAWIKKQIESEVKK